MHRVKLIVRLVENGVTTGGYVRQLELPFVPCVGMKFEQGTSCRLWEVDGDELNPSIEEVVYDLDEEEIVCLLSVEKALSSSFWETLDLAAHGIRCAELQYFRHRNA